MKVMMSGQTPGPSRGMERDEVDFSDPDRVESGSSHREGSKVRASGPQIERAMLRFSIGRCTCSGQVEILKEGRKRTSWPLRILMEDTVLPELRTIGVARGITSSFIASRICEASA